jgi:hypothetical protein
MIIHIEVRDKWIELLKNGMISFIKYIYGWISKDDEFLGHVLASSHFIIGCTFYILVIACHTVYPSIYFQIFVLICIIIIWLQHVLLRVCVSIVAEKELTKLYAPSIPLTEIVLKWFGLTFDDFAIYLIVAETVCIAMFSLELLSKLSVYLFSQVNIYY